MFSRQKVMPNCALKNNYREDPAVLVKYYAFVSLKYYSSKRLRNFGLKKGNFCSIQYNTIFILPYTTFTDGKKNEEN